MTPQVDILISAAADLGRLDPGGTLTIAVKDLRDLLAAALAPQAALPGLDRLAREVRSARAGITSGLDNRRHHPSYGYTKTQLTIDLAKLTGLITGHMIASGAWDGCGDPAAAAREYAADQFRIHLQRLARAIKES